MKTGLLIYLMLVFLPLSAKAQYHLEGRVLSLPGKQPVSYANIGIVNASIGTISDLDGSFFMRIPKAYSSDSILFSALGYEKVSIPVSKLSEGHFLTIYLKETAYKLSEIVVTAERKKSRLMLAGNSAFEGSCFYGDTVTAGASMALLIRNSSTKGKVRFEYPVYVHGAQVMIIRNTFPRFKVRVRFMEAINAGGRLEPGKDLLNASVVVQSDLIDGWLKIDLAPYQFKVQEDFFLIFEWILDKKDRLDLYRQYEKFRKENPDKMTVEYSYVRGEKIAYENFQGNFYFGTSFGISVAGSSLRENICYYRLSSNGIWYPSPSILAAMVMISEQPGSASDQWKSMEYTNDHELFSYYRIGPTLVNRDSLENDFEEESTASFFHSRMDEPIEITLHREANRLTFFANNVSHYPYRLRMDFSRILNLQPVVKTRDFTVYPGSQKLLDFNVADPTMDHFHYELTISETIGDAELQADLMYPYLLPIGPGRLVRIPDRSQAMSRAGTDEFVINTGDTVFAMRKGVISCLPFPDKKRDRIKGEGSLEIIHQDGSVMVYQNLDPAKIFYHEGEIIFPGQALGLLSDTNLLEVHLFEIELSEMLREIPIQYHIKSNSSLPYTRIPAGTRVEYPDLLLRQELTQKELRSLRYN
jgi:hypothetical protein